MKITRRAEFSASHFCRNPQWSEERNREVYGPAVDPHGHNYVLEVSVEGAPDPVTGMVMDLKQLKNIVEQEVVLPMDHRFLNYEVAPFDRVIPTVENVAAEIFKRLRPHLSGPARLESVRLWETADLWAECRGEEV